jgi:hypothetical protein
MMRIEFTIRHTGKEWLVENELITTSAATLEQLDHALKRRLKDEGIIAKGEKIEVFMFYDNSTIPQWIRQYAQHYFNRIVEMEG